MLGVRGDEEEGEQGVVSDQGNTRREAQSTPSAGVSASQERHRQLDAMEAAQREQSRAQAEVSGKIGQGIERQGEVLAKLLRRTV